MKSYLENAERLKTYVWYSRHLQFVELHVHLVYPELWASLGEDLRLFLQQVRSAAQRSREGDQEMQSEKKRSGSGRRRGSRAYDGSSSSSSREDSDGSSSESSDSED